MNVTAQGIPAATSCSPASTTASENTRAPENVLAEAITLKESGNNHHKQGEFVLAVTDYTSAITLIQAYLLSDPQIETEGTRFDLQHLHLPTMLCNRALGHIKLENFGAAVADATLAITMSRSKALRSKSHFRRATANVCLTKYDAAVRDFKSALSLMPSDMTLSKGLTEAQKLAKQQKFAEAIRADATRPLSETIDLDSYVIDSHNNGPVYEGVKSRTPEFFHSVVDYYRSTHENRLHRKCLLMIALDIIALYKEQQNIVEISLPDSANDCLHVCGDVHGQFYDLLEIFRRHGWPSDQNRYLFNGDFVDRGSFSVEVIVTLYLAKLVWPKSIFLTRGNHESRRMTKLYGFEGEMRAKASSTTYDIYCESFDQLPLAHCVNKRIFVVHGGLSARKGVTLQEINDLDRRRDDEEGLMSDLLWADPQPQNGSSPSKRGVSNNFGPDITVDFLNTNNLEMVIRSHEMKEKGYEIAHDGKLLTVFSAPNYCDQMGNLGSVMTFKGNDLNNLDMPLAPQISVFQTVPHPPVRAMQYANPVFI